MKRFEIPSLLDDNFYKAPSFDPARSNVYPWTDGRFILNIFVSPGPEKREMLESEICFSQVYVVGDRLTPITREQRVIDGVRWDFIREVIADKENNKFFIEGVISGRRDRQSCRLFSVPDLEIFEPEIDENGNYNYPEPLYDRYLSNLPFGGKLSVRVGKNSIISGKVVADQTGDFADIFLREVQNVKKDEIIQLRFERNCAFDVKILSFASKKEGKVISVSISLDKLTACAIIAYPYGSWEVVVWDLE